MHWEKSPSSSLGRSRPYQGVRVRDPVKELLRRKRSLEVQNKSTSSTADVGTHSSQPSFTQGIFGSEVAGRSQTEQCVPSGDAGLHCSGWKATPSGAGSGVAGSAVMPWSSSDYSQQDSGPQTLAYQAAPALTADIYMQTLCPSYTMLTYTHTPLLTNFGTLPMAPTPTSLPQMELPDTGLTYLPWAQPLTTISTMPNPGVQFSPGPATLSGSPLVHMPLSMSLTTMIPQMETPGVDSEPQILNLPQHSDQQLDPESQGPSLNEDPDAEPESPSLLDKILEDHKEHGAEENKDSYNSSIFLPNV
ncbi:POU domain class 2-associating factor 1 [Menidia menidia]